MNGLGDNSKTKHLFTDVIGGTEPNSGLYSINYGTNATHTLQGSLTTVSTTTGNAINIIDTNGNISTSGSVIYHPTGNIPSTTAYWSTGVLPDGTFILKNNTNNHISMTADPTTNQVAFDPPIGGGGGWVGNATSDLNMNGYNIINSPSTSQTLTVQGIGHLSGSGTYNPANPATIQITSDATNLNTPSTIVSRDSAGNFSAGTITATLNGQASVSNSTGNILGGTSGNIPVQTSTSTTGFIGNGTSGQVLTSTGAGIPTWSSIPAVNDGTLSVSSTNHITGSGTFTANQAGNTSITVSCDATSSSTPSTLVSRDGTGAFSASSITASTFNGNATTATTASNLSGTTPNTIPYQSASGTTSYISTGTSGQILTSTGAGSAPTWSNAPTVGNGTLTITGDTYLTTSGSFTANQTSNGTISVASNATPNDVLNTIVARDSTGRSTISTIYSSTVQNPSGLLTITGSSGVQTSGKDINFGGGNATFLTSITGAPTTSLTISASAGNPLIIGGASQINVGASGTTEITKLKPDLLVDTVANSTGASGDVYSSTATGTKWITPTTTNTNNALVLRDSVGNFSAGTITASLNGNSSSASQVYVIQNNTNADYQIPTLLTAHVGDANYSLKVDNAPNNFTYNTNTHTLKPVNINLSGALIDSTGSSGTAGQYLTSTGTATDWITPPTIGNGTLTITNGTYMTGSGTFTANQTTNSSITIGTNATSSNTPSTIVARDATGNFTAGTITASLTGPATRIATTGAGASTSQFYPLFVSTSGASASQIVYNDNNGADLLSFYPNAGQLQSYSFTAYNDTTTPNLYINDSANPALFWRMYSPASAITTVNWNGGSFNPLQLNGNNGSIITNNQLAGGTFPTTAIELDTPVISGSNASSGTTGSGSFNRGAVYIAPSTNSYSSLCTTGVNAGTASGASCFISLPVARDNPNNRFLHITISMGMWNNNIASGVNRTFTYNLTGLTFSMTKNGSSFTKFFITSPFTTTITRTYIITGNISVQAYDPFFNLDVYFLPDDNWLGTDTYVFTANYTNTVSASPAGGTFGGVGFTYCAFNTTLPTATGQTYTVNSGTGTFAFGSGALITPQNYLITKSLDSSVMTLNAEYVNAKYLNLCYSGSYSTSSGTAYIPMCFTSAYRNYNVFIIVSNNPTAYATLYVDLLNNSGTPLGTSWKGSINYGAGNTAWGTSSAPIVYLNPTSQCQYSFTITAPLTVSKKFITAVNNGSFNASNEYVNVISTGLATSNSTFYNLLIGVSSGSINGTINIYGWN